MSMFFERTRNPLAKKTPYRRVVGKFPTTTLNGSQGLSTPQNMIYAESQTINGIETIADGSVLQTDVQSVNGAYVIQPSDNLILVDASSNAVGLSIEPATEDLKEINIKIVDFTNAVTITGLNSATVDSLPTYNFQATDMAITLKSYNGNYFII